MDSAGLVHVMSMMAAARAGKPWTVPTEWPPANEEAA